MNSLKKFMLILLLSTGLFAAQERSGKIIGKVKDDSGNMLHGVVVEATSLKMVGVETALSDRDGTFRLFALPSGRYELRFSLPGFSTYVRKDIFVEINQTITLPVIMKPSLIEEEVEVIGMSPIIDVKSTIKGKTLAKEVFMNLPKGRDFTEMISIIPGVHYEENTGGISVDGASGAENMWFVDGTDTTDMDYGTQGQSAVFELIDEIRVNTSGFPAEYGGAMGGVITVITRSGGNTFHGDVVGYFNDHSRLMYGKARDYLRLDPFDDNKFEYVNEDDLLYDSGKSRDGYQRYEGIFSLGGYILKDKLWFFGALNPIYSKTTAPRFFLPDDETQKTNFYRHRWNWNGHFKLTAQLFDGLRVSASYVNNFSSYRGAIPSIYGTSNKDFAWGQEGFDYPNWSANLSLDYVLGNNLLISAMGGVFHSNTTNQKLSLPGTYYFFGRTNDIYSEIPESLVRYRGWSNWGGSRYEYKNEIKDRTIGKMDLTYYANLAGEHSIKAGVQFIRFHKDTDRASQHPNVSLYWGLAMALPSGVIVSGKYGYYEIRSNWHSPYGLFFNIQRDTWSLYLQDSWTLGDRLTLQFGLRAESEYIPSFGDLEKTPQAASMRPIDFDFNDKLSPRIGFVYDVSGDSSLKIFGNYALYYDVMELYFAQTALGGWKWISDYYELNDWDWTKIASSGEINDIVGQSANGANRYVDSWNWRMTDFDSIDPGLKPMSQREITFGFEKKLMEGLSLSVRVVQKHLLRTIEDVGVFTPSGMMFYTANPGEGYSLPVSQGGKMDDSFWPIPKPKREYWAANIAIDKWFSDNWQGGFSYTWSRAAGIYSGLASSDEGGRTSPNVESDFDFWFTAYDFQGNVLDGPLAHDRTHYFKAYGSYIFPFGLNVGLVAYGRSGLPLTTTLGMNGASVYPYNRADLGRLPFTVWGNLYLEYTMKLGTRYNIQINLTIDNFTNTKTWQSRDTSPVRYHIFASDEDILSKSLDVQDFLQTHYSNPAYGQYLSQFDRWWARLGFKFSF